MEGSVNLLCYVACKEKVYRLDTNRCFKFFSVVIWHISSENAVLCNPFLIVFMYQ